MFVWHSFDRNDPFLAYPQISKLKYHFFAEFLNAPFIFSGNQCARVDVQWFTIVPVG